MTAAIKLPAPVLPCDARRRRLDRDWADPEVTKSDLRERGFTVTEMRDARERLGPKAQQTAFPDGKTRTMHFRAKARRLG